MPYDNINLVGTDQPLNELDMTLDEMVYALLNRSELMEADYEEGFLSMKQKQG